MAGRSALVGLTQDQLLRDARRSEAANCGRLRATVCANLRIALPLQTSLMRISALRMWWEDAEAPAFSCAARAEAVALAFVEPWC